MRRHTNNADTMLQTIYTTTLNAQVRRSIKDKICSTFGITPACFYIWLNRGVPPAKKQAVESLLAEFAPPATDPSVQPAAILGGDTQQDIST